MKFRKFYRQYQTPIEILKAQIGMAILFWIHAFPTSKLANFIFGFFRWVSFKESWVYSISYALPQLPFFSIYLFMLLPQTLNIQHNKRYSYRLICVCNTLKGQEQSCSLSLILVVSRRKWLVLSHSNSTSHAFEYHSTHSFLIVTYLYLVYMVGWFMKWKSQKEL